MNDINMFVYVLIHIYHKVPQFKFYEEIKKFEKIDSNDDRRKKAREIYDTFIMRELLSNSGGENCSLSVEYLSTKPTIYFQDYTQKNPQSMSSNYYRRTKCHQIYLNFMWKKYFHICGGIFLNGL